MRPERFLGLDPSPGDLSSIDRVGGALRSTVLALTQSRQKIETLAGPQSIWQGPHARPLVTALTDLAARLRVLEDAVVDFAQAVEAWRTGVVGRQQRTAELTEAVSQLAGRPEAEEERQRLLAEAQALAAEHNSDGVALITAADQLAELLTDTDDEDDLATSLDSALSAILAAVEEWITESAAELIATAEALSDTASLTTVVSQIIGVAGEDAPDEAESVRRLASVSAGAHRLRMALRRSWASLAPEQLPAASFAEAASTGEEISDRLQGGADPEPEGGA